MVMKFFNWLKKVFGKETAHKTDPLPGIPRPEVPTKPVATPSDFPQDQVLQEYWTDYKSATVSAEKVGDATSLARKIEEYAPRYGSVSAELKMKLGKEIPYWVIGIIHHLESDMDWRACLHNGERIIGTGRKTTLVPAGQGPFATWEEAAVDALTNRVSKCPGWDVPNVLRFLEGYNGWGYRNIRINAKDYPQPIYRTVYSAYIWGGTSRYHGGRYVADHVFDVQSFSHRSGAAAIMKMLGVK